MRSTAGIGVFFVCGAAIAQNAGFDRAPWLQDFAALKQALEARYSNLAWFASPQSGVNLPALNRRTLAALEAAESDEDARSALLHFVASFHDGHFSQLATLSPPPGPLAEPPVRPTYTRQDSAGGCAALGYAIPNESAFSMPFESLPNFRLVSDGVSQPFRAGVLAAGNGAKLGFVRIPSFHTRLYLPLCLSAWTRDVWDEDGHLNRPAFNEAVTDAWYQELAAVLQQFRSTGVTAVVADVGSNSGGDDSGDMSARLFTSRPLHSAPLWMAQNQAASGPYFDEQLGELRHALELNPDAKAKEIVEQAIATWTAQKAKLAESVCPMSWVWREQKSWPTDTCRRLVEAGTAGGPLGYLARGTVADPKVAGLLNWPARFTPLWGTWTGPLYVLTNNKTYSSAEMFTAVLQNNQAAKIVGLPTGGDGCGFMTDPEPLELAHSHLRFRIPNCVRIRADGTDEVAGVKPDLPILQYEGENARARAQRAVDAIAADALNNGK